MKKTVSLVTIIIFATSIKAQDLQSLDGSISVTESKSLKTIGESGNNQLMVDSSGDYLQVVVRSKELYVASLCICNENNEVAILHASAALGQIIYRQTASSWTTDQTFDWQMRGKGMDAQTITERNNYLANNGWVANTMGMGQVGETEFIIDRNKFKGELKVAIGLMTARDPNNIIGIPKDAGGCADHKLVSGDPKTSYTFKTNGWLMIK